MKTIRVHYKEDGMFDSFDVEGTKEMVYANIQMEIVRRNLDESKNEIWVEEI